MVDIDNHEDSLKELSKTSLVNNVTIILCWSAAEAARYLELYKSYEHANAGAIRGVESKGYAEKIVDFVTVPRGINKTDAVSLVSAFGSIKQAVNARPEEVAIIGGWGEKKIKKWCTVVDESFRVRKAAKRTLTRKQTAQVTDSILEKALPLSKVPLREMGSLRDKDQEEPRGIAREKTEYIGQFHLWDPDHEDNNEDALIEATVEEKNQVARETRKVQVREDEKLSAGITAALAKLRDNT